MADTKGFFQRQNRQHYDSGLPPKCGWDLGDRTESAKRLPELEAQLPRISEEDLQKKEALLQNYKSQERVVEHLSHMNPYENWTLYDPAEEAES